MDINYFDLSGGINQSSTKTELGLNPSKIFWTDSQNIEIYKNKGIIKQKGNTLLINLPVLEQITGLHELEKENKFKLIITTISGKIYVYLFESNELKLLEKTLVGKDVKFANFLNGILISTELDEMFYLKDNENFDIVQCNLKNQKNEIFYPSCITVYKGRIWCTEGSTIYYSALGTYNDFKTENDAGYIKDFHTDTSDIVTMRTYKDYLAIYKKVMEAHLVNAKNAIEEVQDSYLLGMHTNVLEDNTIGSESSPIVLDKSTIYENFVKLSLALKNSDAVHLGAKPWVVINPNIESYLLQSPEFISAYKVADETLREGSIGRIAGMDVLVSTNLTDVDGKYYVLAGTNEAITFASQLAKIESLRDKDSFSDLVRGLYLYGAKTVQPKALAKMVVTAV